MIAIRQYGWKKRYISEFMGINSRLDEIQAAILSVKLPFLDKNNEQRRKIAAFYNEGLKDIKAIKLPIEPKNTLHVYHQFVICVNKDIRSELMSYMKDNGICCTIHYPEAIPLQPAYKTIPCLCDLSETLRKNEMIISLPMYPELTMEEVEKIISVLRGFFI